MRPAEVASNSTPQTLFNYVLTPSELSEVVAKTPAAISKSFKEREVPLIPLPGRRVGIPYHSVREYLQRAGADYSVRSIAHLNLRGGVAKTTASVHLATRAHQLGHRVVLIDLDSQASATLHFGVRVTENHKVFADIIDTPHKVAEALIEIQPGLHLLPSSLENGLLDSRLGASPPLQKTAVQAICNELEKLGFTLIVIDCSPSLSPTVVSVVCGVDQIVIPVGSDIFSLQGLKLTLEEIETICETFGLDQPEVRILFAKYDGREKLSIESLAELTRHERYSRLLLPCFIRSCAEFSKSAKKGETLFAKLKKSSGRDDYDMYTRELLGFNRLTSGV